MESSDEDWLAEPSAPAPALAQGDGGAAAANAGDVSDEDWLDNFQSQPNDICDVLAIPPTVEGVAEVDRAVVAVARMSRQEAAANARRAKAGRRAALAPISEQAGPFVRGQQQGTNEEGSVFARAFTRCVQSRVKAFLKPASALAEEAGIAPQHFQKHLWGYGNVLHEALVARASKFVEASVKLTKDSESSSAENRVEVALYVRSRKYDETTSVVSCRWDHGPELLGHGQSLTDFEVGPTKIFVTELMHGLVLAKRVSEGSRTYLGVTGSLPCKLQAVESNKAECYLEALMRATRMPFDSLVDKEFPRQVDIACHDEHQSNSKAERGLTVQWPQRAKLELLCDAHKKAAIPTKSFELFRSLPTNCIRLSLSVRGSGMTLLRRHMRHVIKDNLEILSGVPSFSAVTYRKDMLALYLGGTTPGDRYRRHILENLFNGDWRVEGKVQYYDNGQITGGRRAVERSLYTYGVRALLPRTLRVLSRNNWTGTGRSLDDIGLVLVVHSLLKAAYFRMHSVEEDAPEPAAEANNVVPPVARPLQIVDGDVEDWVSGDGLGAGSSEVKQFLEVSSLWHLERVEHVKNSREWMRSGCMFDDLLIARKTFAPQEALILDQLRVTGSEWERKEQDKYRQTGLRSYRMLVAFDGTATQGYLSAVSTMMFELKSWKYVRQTTQAMELFIFKLLARGGSSCYQLLTVRHRTWPYKLLDILRDHNVALELEQAPDCTLDLYTLSFKQYYTGRLSSPEAISELQLVGTLADTDSASTERLHSQNQRRAKFKVWTHPTDLATMSSWFIARGLHRDRAKPPDNSVQSSGRVKVGRAWRGKLKAAMADGLGELPLVKKRRTGGGGPWRAFLHDKSHGVCFTGESLQALSIEYQNLSDAQWEHYQELGMAAAELHQEGLRSFGPRSRQCRGATALAGQAATRVVSTAAAQGALGDEAMGGQQLEKQHLEVIVAPPFVDEARRLRAQALAACREVRKKDAALRKELATVGDGLAEGTPVCCFGLTGSGRSPDLGVAARDFSAVPSPLPLLCFEAAVPPQQLDEAISNAVQMKASAWDMGHTGILHAPLPKLTCPVKRRLCHEAQRCVCTGGGHNLYWWAVNLQSAGLKAKKTFGVKAFSALLHSSDLVCCFSWSEAPPCPSCKCVELV